MSRRLYFGNIQALLISQNGQGRFFGTSPTTSAEVYESRRNQFFTVEFGQYNFDFNLANQTYEFYTLHGERRELVAAGWDGLTQGQQMAFVSELYDFLRTNRMTDADFEEFLADLAKSPI